MELDRLVDEVSTQSALVLAGISTVALVALHLAAPHLRNLPGVPERRTASFAGGIAVAYVFLHLLPELAEGHALLREVFQEAEPPTPLAELGIFLVALVGFCLFYALERAAERHRAARAGAGPQVFYVHLGSFAIYNGVITYTMSSTYRTSVGFGILFTVAMGLHFVLSDRGLLENYGRLFDRWPPRLVLAAALAVGWALSATLAPTRAITVSLLVAFLSGSVLLNVFKEELPSSRQSSLPWFLAGAALYGGLLAGLTLLRPGEGG